MTAWKSCLTLLNPARPKSAWILNCVALSHNTINTLRITEECSLANAFINHNMTSLFPSFQNSMVQICLWKGAEAPWAWCGGLSGQASALLWTSPSLSPVHQSIHDSATLDQCLWTKTACTFPLLILLCVHHLILPVFLQLSYIAEMQHYLWWDANCSVPPADSLWPHGI